MSETLKKPEPPVDNSKKIIKYGLLLMVAGAFVMVMDRARLVVGVIIMGYAALQLLLYVVLSRRKYRESYRQYEEELQKYEIEKQKEQQQLAALREQYKRTTAKPAQNAYIEPNIQVTVEYDYADDEEEYDFVDAEEEYDFMDAEEEDEEELRRLKEEEELADWLEQEEEDTRYYEEMWEEELEFMEAKRKEMEERYDITIP